MRLIDADALLKTFKEKLDVNEWTTNVIRIIIEDAPTVELDEGVIQEVLNKRCMTVITNEYLIELLSKRPLAKCENCDLYFKAMTKEEMRKGGAT